MEPDKKNQYTLLVVILVLLITVFVIGLFIISKNHGGLITDKDMFFKQLYYSEYKLDMIDSDYYIGYLDKKEINVIVNNKGEEIFNNGVNIFYDGIYKTKEDNYLIYSNQDNKLVVYIFNGKELKKFYTINEVSYVKPIIYTNGNISYIVGFSSNVNGDLYLYMLNDSGLIVVKNASLVGDDSNNDVYYTYSNSYLVVVNKDSLYGVIDFNGKFKINYKYKDIMNTYDGKFIVKDKKNRYGIIDTKRKELVKTNYKAIEMVDNYYLVVDKNNNMALYDNKLKNETGFKMKYDSLIDFDLRSKYNSINLWKVGNNIVVVNNYLQDINKTEYSLSNAYFIHNGKIFNTIKQLGFGSTGIVYSYDNKYNVTVYDTDLVEKYTIRLKGIKKINQIRKETEEIVKISYVDHIDNERAFYYKKDNQITFDYGNVIDIMDNHYVVKRDNEISIYDHDFNKIDSLEGKNIRYKNGYLIVDNGIYMIERRG